MRFKVRHVYALRTASHSCRIFYSDLNGAGSETEEGVAREKRTLGNFALELADVYGSRCLNGLSIPCTRLCPQAEKVYRYVHALFIMCFVINDTLIVWNIEQYRMWLVRMR